MVQQWRRSYFYFISFAKKKGIASAPRKGSVFARAKQVYKPLAPRPDWDNTIHDLSAWRLSPNELEARRIAFKTLPEHRVRRSVSSATSILSCNVGPELCTETRGSTTAIDKPEATAEEALRSLSQTKHLKDGNRIPRVGKENRTLSKQESKKRTKIILKARAAESVWKISKPPADTLRIRGAHSGDGGPQIAHHTIAQETELGGNQKLRARPTVDFEEEVKQFEARTKFLVQAVKPRLDSRLTVSKRVKIKRPWDTLAKILHNRKFPREGVMDKSDSSDDDSSFSGPWENSITRFQKAMRPVPQHHHHRKHYSRRVQEEAPAATKSGANQPSKFNHWAAQPQNEVVYLKQQLDPTIKPRTKLAKRHFGSIQTTSTIGDWKVDYQEGPTDHLSLQQVQDFQDFQRHMLKCQHDLTQEFKEFKISISKQIMNLQLDIDTVLELQKRKDSYPAETTVPSSYRTGQETPVPEGVGESVDLPTYASMKVKKASPSSGESSHVPLFSCYDGSQYAGSRKSTRSVYGSEDGPHPSAVAAPDSHVFDNPIYHVQTSSEKDGGNSDSDASISSVELAKFLASRGGYQHLKSESRGNGRDYVLANDANFANHGIKSPGGLLALGIEEKKNTSLVPYGISQNQEVEETRYAESGNLENSYSENRIESNGHAQSNTIRLRDSSGVERSVGPSTEVPRPSCKSGSTPSHRLRSDRTQCLEAAEEDTVVSHDLELRLGNSRVNSAVNSGRNSPKDYITKLSPSVSRPLFTTGNWSTVSNSSNVRDGHQIQDRERSEEFQEQQSSRNSKLPKNADDREVFTLRGWSAAFLQQAEKPQKDRPSSSQPVENQIEHPNRTKTPEPPKKEVASETGNGTMRFQGRCARGGVAWTVSEPPGSAKKSRNVPIL